MIKGALRASVVGLMFMTAARSWTQTPPAESPLRSPADPRATGTLSDTTLVIAYNQRAREHTGNGALDSALQSTGLALDLLERMAQGQRDARALDRHFLNAYKLQGIAHFYGSDYAKALVSIQHFLRTAERMGSTTDIGAGYNYMSYCFRSMGDATNARVNAMKAIAVLRELPEGEDIANAYTGLASIYADADRVDSAMHFNRLALSIYTRTGNVLNATNTRLNMAEIHMKADRFDSSLIYLEAARSGVEEMNEASTLSKFHGQMGRALVAQGRFKEAATELEHAEALALEMDNAEDLGHIYDLQALEAARRGELKEAFELVHKGRDAMMRDLNVRKAQELTEARLTFEHEQEQARTEIALAQQRRLKRYALVGGALMLAIAVLLLILYRTTQRSRTAIQKEKDVADELLLNILPGEVADELKRMGHTGARQFERVTILFTDFEGFTRLSEQMEATELVSEIDHCFKAFDAIAERYAIEKIKTIGDAYMCAGGLPDPTKASPANVVRAALDMQDHMRARAEQRIREGRRAFTMRAGIHTGPVVAGIVGDKKFQYDLWGDTVNTASRMESSGEVGQVNISEATYALVKDAPGLSFDHRGKVKAKGKGELDMYFVARTPA